MFFIFLSSYRNTRESLEEFEKAVKTHSISRSPKLSLVFLKLDRNTVHVFYFLNERMINNAIIPEEFPKCKGYVIRLWKHSINATMLSTLYEQIKHIAPCHLSHNIRGKVPNITFLEEKGHSPLTSCIHLTTYVWGWWTVISNPVIKKWGTVLIHEKLILWVSLKRNSHDATLHY